MGHKELIYQRISEASYNIFASLTMSGNQVQYLKVIEPKVASWFGADR